MAQNILTVPAWNDHAASRRDQPNPAAKHGTLCHRLAAETLVCEAARVPEAMAGWFRQLS